jgi:KipI family sensor histidine kinase inhibitor
MYPIRILQAGDSALVVSLPQAIDPEINAWCVAFAETAGDRWGSALRDVVVGYCTVTVYFDPLQVDPAWLEPELESFARSMAPVAVGGGDTVDVPVVYGGASGPDLETVAQFAGCSADEVIARHAAVTYRVYLVGFVPGFAYMATVDPLIAAPRRSTPRTLVPAGSVAIAGGQTGIYPDTTPGGWNIIGRTRLKPFDPARGKPALFKPGDDVRFHAVANVES